jgi:NADH-quinone oxidoreductase subunit J
MRPLSSEAGSAAKPRKIGQMLFTEYLLPFEVISVLILIAILGAVVLAQKEIE